MQPLAELPHKAIACGGAGPPRYDVRMDQTQTYSNIGEDRITGEFRQWPPSVRWLCFLKYSI